MLITTKKIASKSSKYFMKQQETIGMVDGYIEEMMSGQKVIKVFTHEEKAKEAFDKLNEQLNEDMYVSIREMYYKIFINTVGSHVMVYNT